MDIHLLAAFVRRADGIVWVHCIEFQSGMGPLTSICQERAVTVHVALLADIALES